MKKILAIALATILVVAMAVPASAAIMSKQQDTDPHVKQIDVDGEVVDFVIYDDNGDPIEGDWDDDGKKFITEDKDGNLATYELILVPYHNKDNAPTEEIKTALEVAYQAAKSGEYDEIAGGKVLSAIVYIGLKKTDYLGAVSYVGVDDISTAKKMIIQFQEKYTLAITSDGETFIKANEGDFVKIGSAGVFALFKDQGTGKDDGKSPQTGYESNTGIVVAVSLVAALTAIVGVCYIVDKKRA